MMSVAAAFAVVGLVGVTSTEASAPLAKTQSGWFRMTLGDFEVTALSDGTAPLPMQDLLQGPKDKINAALSAAFLTTSPQFETSVNGYLINTGTKLILIDTGAGGLFGPTLGKLIANLKASGYQPEQVDEIYITHLHADHIGNLTLNGKIVFTKAIVRAGKADGDFWLSKDNLAKAPDGFKPFFKGAQDTFDPWVKAGKVKWIEAEGELVPGIKAIPAAGHTPGHTIYEVTSKGQKLVVWGDLMHVAAVQFPNPEITIQFDSDPKAAAAARAKAFADAASTGYIAAIAHVPFPGIGQLRKDGTGYRFYPINFTNSLPAPAKK